MLGRRRCWRWSWRRRRERPARRLPDADRQPRGRHAARAVGAARGRRRRVRGHAPHAHAARPLRGEGQLVSYHEHNERARARSWWGGCATGRLWRWCRDAGMPLVSDPGFVLVRGCVAAGLRGRGAARTVGGGHGARGVGAARRAVALRRLPAAQEGRAARGCFGSAGETLVAFESPRRVPASLAVLAELDPEREVAVCRELTKVHEEVVRGTAAELAERYADGAAEGRGRPGGRARRGAAGGVGAGARRAPRARRGRRAARARRPRSWPG